MSRVIALFDFDGTVTKKDSLLEFIRYVKGDLSFVAGFILHSPVLILYKLQVISNQRAKEMILRFFFGKMNIDTFNRHCENFTREKIPDLIRPKALREINKLKGRGAEVVIVSASPENWLRNWCETAGVNCIATRLAVNNNRITGKIDGLNCHGEEKARRILEEYDLGNFSSVYGYGDTNGDLPMLDLANYKFYKPFR